MKKGDITELKSLKAPPLLVKKVMESVAILFGVSTDWQSCQKMLGSAEFFQNLQSFNTSRVTPEQLQKLQPIVSDAEF